MTLLTDRRVDAICRALAAVLAGEIEDDDLTREDYDAALDWANETREVIVSGSRKPKRASVKAKLCNDYGGR